MKKPIELADTTFRAYKKKNGATILHLRTHLIVYADASFRAKIRGKGVIIDWNEPRKPSGLAAFLKVSPDCWLKLPGNERLKCEIGYCGDSEARSRYRLASDGKMYFEREDITDGKCVLFHFYVETIVRGKDTNIFGEDNLFGVCIGDLKLTFCINFPGRPSNEKIVFDRKAPILRRGRGW